MYVTVDICREGEESPLCGAGVRALSQGPTPDCGMQYYVLCVYIDIDFLMLHGTDHICLCISIFNYLQL